MEPTQTMTGNIYGFDDTICAISTPPGVGGIAVARICGQDAISITDKIWQGKRLSDAKSHTAHLGTILAPDGSTLDEGVATVFRAPRSYTGQDTVEISVHGSRWIQRELISALVAAGARPAEPGEFTRRAFAAGRFDLSEAEAVADLIASSSKAAHRLAINQMRGSVSKQLESLRKQLVELASLLELELDFSEEDLEFASRTHLVELAEAVGSEISRLTKTYRTGTAIKEGIPVAIIGHTNAGKSSLLNALVGDERAIVSEIHGTTRDIVEDRIELGSYLIRLQDTAGLRQDTDDTIERIGIERSINAAVKAEIIIYLIDASSPATQAEIEAELTGANPDRIIYAINKTDLCRNTPALPHNAQPIELSIKNATGLDTLRNAIIQKIEDFAGGANADLLITNARQAAALEAASNSNRALLAALRSGIPADLVAQDLRETLHHLATVTGSVTTPEILATIFSRFCIGK